MTGFLDLPLELRNYIYDLLLWQEVDPIFRGVMVVSEHYVKRDLPPRCYCGLLRVCRQVCSEFRQAIQHLVASKQLQYDLNVTFSHGRPYFSIAWLRFPALSPTINHLFINVDLRTREPFREEGSRASLIPHEHELAHLLEDSPKSFAVQLFDYIAILLKTLANLLAQGDPRFRVIYTETMTLNFRTPTTVINLVASGNNLVNFSRRVQVPPEEATKLHETMRNTLKATSKEFQAFNANDCDRLFPLIQIGSLRFATEGEVWGEGHNLVLAHENFQWLRY
ncbi:hypothetical protein NX059_007854 [Plenodomus lindquistii]|nr:hypothetical protein NX059_007854 [Plenodomus lindquistii]